MTRTNQLAESFSSPGQCATGEKAMRVAISWASLAVLRPFSQTAIDDDGDDALMILAGPVSAPERWPRVQICR
jgi:hypothetical protein